jgi:peptidylprolyl isomerase
MLMNKIFYPIFLVGCITMSVCAQPLSSVEREILQLQDERSLGNGKLVSYLSHADAHIRARAALALANIQDTTTTQPLLPLLSDPSPKVRQMTAFALGLIGSARAQAFLLARLSAESDSSVLGRIFEALARLGDERALDAVTEFVPSDGQPNLHAERALSIARFALRNIKNERSMWYCFDRVRDVDGGVRWRALFALWRAAPHGLIDIEIAKRMDDLKKTAVDANADVRINLATLLGRTKASEAIELLHAMKGHERQNPEWRVQVQLAKGFAAFVSTYPELLRDLLDLLEEGSDHVQISVLQSLQGLQRQVVQQSSDSVRARTLLVRFATTKPATAELVRGEAIVALARFFPEEFTRRNFLADSGLSVRERAKVIEALSTIPTVRSLVTVMEYLESDTVRVAMAAWDFIRRFLTASTVSRLRAQDPDLFEIGQMLYRKTLRSLERGDMAITQLVATALSDTGFYRSLGGYGSLDSIAYAVESAYRKLTSPDDVESMQAVLAAMGRIGEARFIPVIEESLKDTDKTVVTSAAAALQQLTGKDYSSHIPQSTTPAHRDYDWPMLESISGSTRVTISTDKGILRLQLNKEEAPFTVLSFVKLVRKGFYNGLIFHRVVPNFVVQGGDPRGDGWGGPGYAIRTEVGLTYYERGSVGMASAGKDTEGCQFFITHLPTPHLDGRYTIFARVVEGMDVVDRLQVGDRILQISIE